MRAEIIEQLKDLPVEKFVSRFILERTPFIFQNNHYEFLDWRATIAEKLLVDGCAVIITGSAGVGISLNPTKNFKAFDDTSDVDVAVVSMYHFEEAWRRLRNLRSGALRLTSIERRAIQMHREHYIYWGTIATDKILPVLPFGHAWQQSLSEMARITPTHQRTINVRVYRDFESLRGYQAHNVANLREQLLTSS